MSLCGVWIVRVNPATNLLIIKTVQAAAVTLLRLLREARPTAAMPVAKSGRAAGRGMEVIE